MNKLLISITLAFSLVGCISSDSANRNCADCYYASKNALPCPLCGDRAIVARWYKDPNYYFYNWPEDIVEKGWLYQCECRNKYCPVNPDTPAFMREGDAIREWNEIAGRKYR